MASPRSLGTDRLGPHLAAVGAVVFAAWFLLAFGTDGAEPPLPVVVLLGAVLVITPAAAFFVPAFVAGRRDRSLRSGLRATVWTVIAAMPLAYALWLPEALRRHAIDGRTLDGELIAPVGVNLTDALTFSFGIFPVLGLTVGLVGAALGARRAALGARRAARWLTNTQPDWLRPASLRRATCRTAPQWRRSRPSGRSARRRRISP